MGWKIASTSYIMVLAFFNRILFVLYMFPCIFPIMCFEISVKVNKSPEIQYLYDQEERNKVNVYIFVDTISEYDNGCKRCK